MHSTMRQNSACMNSVTELCLYRADATNIRPITGSFWHTVIYMKNYQPLWGVFIISGCESRHTFWGTSVALWHLLNVQRPQTSNKVIAGISSSVIFAQEMESHRFKYHILLIISGNVRWVLYVVIWSRSISVTCISLASTCSNLLSWWARILSRPRRLIHHRPRCG